MRFLSSILISVALAGCATYKPVPDDFRGATAVVADSGKSESGSKAQMFVVSEVDGNKIWSSVDASRQASSGRGFSLRTVFVERKVPIRPMRVKLLATHQAAAPIREMASQIAGTWYSVEGVVDFTPVADGNYVVRGELRKESSSVWIEDARTMQVVTAKVSDGYASPQPQVAVATYSATPVTTPAVSQTPILKATSSISDEIGQMVTLNQITPMHIQASPQATVNATLAAGSKVKRLSGSIANESGEWCFVQSDVVSGWIPALAIVR